MFLAAAAGFILLLLFMGMIFRNILTIIIFIGILYLIGVISQAHSQGWSTLQEDLRQDRIERAFHPECQVRIQDAIVKHKSSSEISEIARNCTGYQPNPFFEMCRKTPGCLEKMAQ